jgi:hypothetical protein
MLMIVRVTKRPPSPQQLVEKLKSDFSSSYRYTVFGSGNKETVIVAKSSFVGVQISNYEHEFRIQAITPMFALALIPMMIQWSIDIFQVFSPSAYIQFEKQVGNFLQKSYN